MKAAKQSADESAFANRINIGVGLTPDETLLKDVTKMLYRIDKLLVPGDSLQANDITPKIQSLVRDVLRGSYFLELGEYPKEEIKGKKAPVYLTKNIDWDRLQPALHSAINNGVEDYEWPVRISEEFYSEKATLDARIEKIVKGTKLERVQRRNKQPALLGKWRQKAYPPREYEKLTEYFITKNIPDKELEEVRSLLKTPLDGYVGQAYNYDDHEITQDWMLSFYDNKTSRPSDDDVARTQIEGLLEIMVNKVENRVCTENGVLRRDPVGLGPDLKEVPVWGIDCYTRRMVELAIEDGVPEERGNAESIKTFIERKLLPAINAQSEQAFNMTRSAVYIAENPTSSHRDVEYATALKAAIEEFGLEEFRIHPKGTGVICTNPAGIPPHVFITEYLGELYPSYRWCERLDVVEQAQKAFELKPTLPDFYNILLERPRQDPAGYGLMYVDASQRANMGSSCSHSCDPNCTSAVVARNGNLVIALTTNRQVYYGEELTMDYYSITFSDVEWRAAICLCGKSSCRGSFLHYATQDDLQQVLNQNCGPLWRYATLLRACVATSLSSEDREVLTRHGMGSAALGPNPPIWMQKYAVDNLKFVEYERKGLPCALLRPKEGKPSQYSFIEADMDARTVMEQRLQSLVCCYSMVSQVLSKSSPSSGSDAGVVTTSSDYPLGIYKASEALGKVWDVLRTIPGLIVEHLLQENSKKKQKTTTTKKAESTTATTTAASSTTAESVEGSTATSDSASSRDKRLWEVVGAVEAILNEQAPRTLSALTAACLNIRKLLLGVESLSNSNARLGQLADVLVFWAYTSNYSFAKEYAECMSEPVTVVARELGNNIQKSQLRPKQPQPTTSKRRSRGTAESGGVSADALLPATSGPAAAVAPVEMTAGTSAAAAAPSLPSVVSMETLSTEMDVSGPAPQTTTSSTPTTAAVSEVSVVTEEDPAPTFEVAGDVSTAATASEVGSPEKSSAASAGVIAVTPDSTVPSAISTTSSEKDVSSATKKTSSGSSDAYLKPNDPVFTGTMKYPSQFVFWQLMGWYNAGTDDKCTAPNLFGSVQLPVPACCFGPSENPYTSKSREMLIDLLKDDKTQMMPWSPALIKTFNSSKSSSPGLYGSPMLDAALGQVGAATKVHAILQGRDPDAKRVRDYSNKKDLKALSDEAAMLAKNNQPDCIIPPETNTSWIQCDLCSKWRRLAWHVNADTLPEQWDCSLNTWDADTATCSAPQDAYDTEKESTVSFNVAVQKLEDFQVGTYRDVYCTKNKIYYEAVIMKVSPGKKAGDPERIQFHFKGWNHKFDEWIPANSERIQPHNLFTNPFAENVREQEKWQGVTGIKSTIISAFHQDKRSIKTSAASASSSRKRKSGEMVVPSDDSAAAAPVVVESMDIE